MIRSVLIDYEKAVAVIRRLLEVAEQSGASFKEPIVMVGGTAMAAHRLRKMSYDVDIFAADYPDEVINMVEQEFRLQFGHDFKIDITSVENIWGHIMLRDIKDSESDMELNIGDRSVTVRKLGLTDLFLLKLDSVREKDQDDLPLLFEKINVDDLISRFNTVWKWHSDRDAVLGLADSFINILKQLGDIDPRMVIGKLELPKNMLSMLSETWESVK